MTVKTPSSAWTHRWRLPSALALVAVVTLAVYWGALANGFIDYDDTDYVTLNQAVRSGVTLDGLKWALTAFHAANWHPLTWISHMVDCELFGLNPAWHHGVNVLLHAVNGVLICALLYRMTGFLGRSVLVALLFALHPLHVESVAWIAERKDVLSTLFWLLTMGAYLGYVQKSGVCRYLLVLLLFVLGLMAKQMVVTLPLVFLIMDWWPLGRCMPGANKVPWRRLLLEKLPLLSIAAAASLLTIRAQSAAGALRGDAGYPLAIRLGNAMLSYADYLGKMAWPARLALFYPFDIERITMIKVGSAVLLLVAISGLAIWLRRRQPWLLFGWCWYLITLVPVIGFIKVGDQAMADRYTYIPSIGIFVALIWGGAVFAGGWRNGQRVAAVATGCALILSSWLTVAQIRYWHTSYELYSHALEVTQRNWVAHNNMGILLSQNNRLPEAIRHFRESVRINPLGAEGFRNLGNAYQMAGDQGNALAAFIEAVRLRPDNAEGHYRLGLAYLMNGDKSHAYGEYLQLQRLDAKYAQPLLDAMGMSGG